MSSPVDSGELLMWLRTEWTALANDLDRQADRLEQLVDSLRQRAIYARQKADRVYAVDGLTDA